MIHIRPHMTRLSKLDGVVYWSAENDAEGWGTTWTESRECVIAWVRACYPRAGVLIYPKEAAR